MLQRCTGCGLYLGVFSLDGAMPRWAALLVAPAVLTINFIERLRARSDALLIIAKPR